MVGVLIRALFRYLLIAAAGSAAIVVVTGMLRERGARGRAAAEAPAPWDAPQPWEGPPSVVRRMEPPVRAPQAPPPDTRRGDPLPANGADAARQAELTRRIEGLRAALRAAPARNPHEREYQAAKKAHADYWRKVRAIQAAWESAEGAKRIELGDTLRGMKGEDIRLGQALEAARRKVAAWEQTHGTAQARATLRELEAELARLGSRSGTGGP
jgi:hypothetical protein